MNGAGSHAVISKDGATPARPNRCVSCAVSAFARRDRDARTPATPLRAMTVLSFRLPELQFPAPFGDVRHCASPQDNEVGRSFAKSCETPPDLISGVSPCDRTRLQAST